MCYLDFAVRHQTLPKLVFVRGYLLRHPCKRRQQEKNYVFNFHNLRSHQDLIIYLHTFRLVPEPQTR